MSRRSIPLEPCEAPGSQPRRQSGAIGRAATLALYDELALSPKPGLVTLDDCGSHRDMDARTFMRSILSLRGYFAEIAALGAGAVDFAQLQRCGIDAEHRMQSATGGINTHRGAIFMLGLLCATAGIVTAEGRHLQPDTVRDALCRHWGADLAQRARTPSRLPGGIATQRHGLRGAAQEAAAGFPIVFDVAVPALERALGRGLPRHLALLDTLFHIMAVLEDSNLVHRGGIAGLKFAQNAARAFLAAGGAAQTRAEQRASAIGAQFVIRNLSPGGAADTLAAACWVQRLGMLSTPIEST